MIILSLFFGIFASISKPARRKRSRTQGGICAHDQWGGGIIIQICSGAEIIIPAWDGSKNAVGGGIKISGEKVEINE